MQERVEELVARAREERVALTREGGLLTDLTRHVLQTGLEMKMAEHLGYERGQAPPGGVGNARVAIGVDATAPCSACRLGPSAVRGLMSGRRCSPSSATATSKTR
jgi:hypothetical protein